MATTAAPAEAAAVKKAMDIKSPLAAVVPSAVRQLPLVLRQAREHALLGHYDKALELHARALKEVRMGGSMEALKPPFNSMHPESSSA